MNNIFNNHRIFALILLLFGSVIWWYSLVLLTNPEHQIPWPNKIQYIGLVIAIIIAVISWLSKCFTIIPNNS